MTIKFKGHNVKIPLVYIVHQVTIILHNIHQCLKREQSKIQLLFAKTIKSEIYYWRLVKTTRVCSLITLVTKLLGTLYCL